MGLSVLKPGRPQANQSDLVTQMSCQAQCFRLIQQVSSGVLPQPETGRMGFYPWNQSLVKGSMERWVVNPLALLFLCFLLASDFIFEFCFFNNWKIIALQYGLASAIQQCESATSTHMVPSLLNLTPHPIPPLQVVTEHQAELPVPIQQLPTLAGRAAGESEGHPKEELSVRY